MKRDTILIADDDPAQLRALEARLTAEGYDVIATADGYQALDRARHLRPALMLLDIRMPAGSGLSVHERKEKIPEIRDIPVIYLTGLSPDSVDEAAERLGAFAILHKPCETQELLRTIGAALEPWACDPVQ